MIFKLARINNPKLRKKIDLLLREGKDMEAKNIWQNFLNWHNKKMENTGLAAEDWECLDENGVYSFSIENNLELSRKIQFEKTLQHDDVLNFLEPLMSGKNLELKLYDYCGMKKMSKDAFYFYCMNYLSIDLGARMQGGYYR